MIETSRSRWSLSAAGVACALSVLVGVLLLGACSRESGRGGAAGDVRLEFWTLALKPRFNDYINARLRAFEQANPGVSVTWVDVPLGALNRKFIAAAAAGRGPDVVNLSDMQYGRFVGLGALADMRGHVPGDPASVYLPGALRLGEIDGRLMALPWYLTTQVSMMNAELLREGGLDETSVASTWAALREQARAYHAKTGKYLFSQSLGSESQILIMMMGDGIAPLKVGAEGLEPDLLNDRVVEYVRGWVEFYRSGAMPEDAATRNHAHLTEMYQDGRLAMIDTGPNFLSRVRDTSPSVFGKTRVRAGVTGTLGRQHIATMVLSVSSTSKHPKEAARLAWFMTSHESQMGLCAMVPVLPSTKETLETDLIQGRVVPEGTPAAEAEARAISARALPTAVAFTPAVIAWPDLRRAFEDGIKGALLDKRDVRETLGDIQKQWERLLKATPARSGDAMPMKGAA